MSVRVRFLGGSLHGKGKVLPDVRDSYHQAVMAKFTPLPFGYMSTLPWKPIELSVEVYTALDICKDGCVLLMYTGKRP